MSLTKRATYVPQCASSARTTATYAFTVTNPGDRPTSTGGRVQRRPLRPRMHSISARSATPMATVRLGTTEYVCDMVPSSATVVTAADPVIRWASTPVRGIVANAATVGPRRARPTRSPATEHRDRRRRQWLRAPTDLGSTKG